MNTHTFCANTRIHGTACAARTPLLPACKTLRAADAMRLISLADERVALDLPGAGSGCVLGRTPELGIQNLRVSRRHATVWVDDTVSETSLRLKAHRRLWVQRQGCTSSSTSVDEEVVAGASTVVSLGDCIYLHREAGGTLTCGFRVVTTPSPAAMPDHKGEPTQHGSSLPGPCTPTATPPLPAARGARQLTTTSVRAAWDIRIDAPSRDLALQQFEGAESSWEHRAGTALARRRGGRARPTALQIALRSVRGGVRQASDDRDDCDVLSGSGHGLGGASFGMPAITAPITPTPHGKPAPAPPAPSSTPAPATQATTPAAPARSTSPVARGSIHAPSPSSPAEAAAAPPSSISPLVVSNAKATAGSPALKRRAVKAAAHRSLGLSTPSKGPGPPACIPPAPDRDEAGKQGQGSFPIFAGMVVCFWEKAHVQLLQALVVKHGGRCEKRRATLDTTHIVVRSEAMTEAQARERARSEVAQSASAPRMGLHAAPCSTVASSASPSDATDVAARGHGRRGVRFVTPDYFTVCIQQRQKLPELLYAPDFLQPLSAHGDFLGACMAHDQHRGQEAMRALTSSSGDEAARSSGSGSDLEPGPPAQLAHPDAPQRAGPDAMPVPHDAPLSPAALGQPTGQLGQQRWGGSAQPASPPPPSPLHDQSDHPAAATAPAPSRLPLPSGPAEPDASASIFTDPTLPLPGNLAFPPAPMVSERMLPPWSPPAIPGQVLPGPEDICPSPGDQWGVDGRWIEPWDEALARDTLRKLYEVWQPSHSKRVAAAAAAAAEETTGGSAAPSAAASDGEGQTGTGTTITGGEGQAGAGAAVTDGEGQAEAGEAVTDGRQSGTGVCAAPAGDSGNGKAVGAQAMVVGAVGAGATVVGAAGAEAMVGGALSSSDDGFGMSTGGDGVDSGSSDGGGVMSSVTKWRRVDEEGRAGAVGLGPACGTPSNPTCAPSPPPTEGVVAHAKARVAPGPSWEQGTPTNGVCGHAACSAQSYCFLPELERIIRNYNPHERFQKKAIQKAISCVRQLPQPLRSPLDVDRLLPYLGDRTREKLRDIIEGGGQYWRNRLREDDEWFRVVSEFVDIWGAGQQTAEEWYRCGCRTLEDVAALPSLSAMQRVGVRYHREFMQRVPRPEVAECERIVREEFIEVLHGLTHLDRQRLGQRLHVRAVGSYLRGRPTTADIDFMIAPSPAAYSVPDAHRLLHPHVLCQQLIVRLVARGYAIDALNDEAGRPPGSGHAERVNQPPERGATFMGVWKGPSSPMHRRLDIKIHPWHVIAFALNYFSSSKNFSRAIRHYARWGVTPEQVRRVSGGTGDHFHLSNYDLVPMVWVGHRELPAGPPVPARCETHIFNALGLHYVPPHMRNVDW